MAQGNRRSPAPGGRRNQVMVALSDSEFAEVSAAAGRDGMAAGAWLGVLGVRGAAGPGPALDLAPLMRELMMLRAELMENRRVLTNIGGNLNDVARHANTTGHMHVATAMVQQLVARVVGQVEETVGRVDDMATATRVSLTRRRR
jgi:hypothetical protein